MTRMLIAVDGSIESKDAARYAHRLFGDAPEYLVLTVADASATLAGAIPMADPAMTGAYVSPEVAQESVDTILRQAEESAHEGADSVETRATTIVEMGDPGETICRVAAEHDVDLIVIGSHDRGWLSRLVTPSVRNHLVEHAPCPVLVVR
jgi:nucleotide-binding universal stress UspA family protein